MSQGGRETRRRRLAPAILALALLTPVRPSSVFAQDSALGGVEGIQVTWAPQVVPQGTLFEVRLSGPGAEAIAAAGRFAGEPLHFHPIGSGELAALAAVPVDAAGELPLDLAFASSAAAPVSVQRLVPVLPGEYPMERLRVAPEFGDPYPPEIQRRIEEESARAAAVARASHQSPRMWEPPFIAPRGTRVTSGFGGGRLFNDQVTSRHTGTDFAGAVGEQVLAPARGVVALVDAFYLGGNVIYVDHGAGLVTAYLHLSAQEVRVGDTVEPGQVIGRVGATGRVTGPHLHWIVRYGTISVDGLSLLSLR
jgi:murein DD-endopeptidase MepM/ murein hydrolase activator NlpD